LIVAEVKVTLETIAADEKVDNPVTNVNAILRTIIHRTNVKFIKPISELTSTKIQNTIKGAIVQWFKLFWFFVLV